MPRRAIYSRLKCDFVLPPRDGERGEYPPAPLSGPLCEAEVIGFCRTAGSRYPSQSSEDLTSLNP
jgi:hypothetical protein